MRRRARHTSSETMTWKAFVRATRPTFPCPSLSTSCTRKIVELTGSSSLEELNRTGTLLVNTTTATPTLPWNDSQHYSVGHGRVLRYRDAERHFFFLILPLDF